MRQQAKILNLEVDCCDDCPYCKYDGDYGMSYDAGMDCHHPESPGSGRIVNEGSYIDMRNRKMQKAVESGVPKWCPLPNRPECKNESPDDG